MRTLTQNLIDRKNLQFADQPWIWLYRLVADQTTSATTVFQLTSSDEEVTFDGLTYYPFDITHTVITSTEEGDLPEIQVVLNNISREVGAHLEIGDGFIGHECTITLVHKAHLATAADKVVIPLEVRSAVADDDAVALALALPNLYDAVFPADIITRNRCRWVYKGDGCKSRSVKTTCGHHVDDCIVRGDDHVTQGLPRIHPRRFGGAPGLVGARR